MPKRPTQRFCEFRCRQLAERERYYKTLSLTKSLSVSSSTVGAIGELRVSVDLMSRGFSVFRALSPTCPADLVALRGGICKLVEVKTVTENGGQISRPMTKGGQFDVLAMVLPDRIVYEPSLF